MDILDGSTLDHLDLNQTATVYWEGPNRVFTKLSSAIITVMDEISNNPGIPPGITIFETPYFLEVEQIENIYKRRIVLNEVVLPVTEVLNDEVPADKSGFNQLEIDELFNEALKELGGD